VSRVNAQHDMARCRNCGDDLAVRAFPAVIADSGVDSDGQVYCTNGACGFSTVRYPIGSAVEAGKLPR
jgi:hypothetical protein